MSYATIKVYHIYHNSLLFLFIVNEMGRFTHLGVCHVYETGKSIHAGFNVVSDALFM